jgi:predicted aldo/keto reductase-like oxidoreductase
MRELTRRSFIRGALGAAGAVVLTPNLFGAAEKVAKRTAADQIVLGKTGLKMSRLGLGAGTNSGNVQRALGHEEFDKLVRYAIDQGITYIDTAESYQTHEWVRQAVKGIAREKLYIQSKMPGTPEKPLEVLDRYRKELGVEYIDSVLVHCACTKNWDEERKRTMDALAEAKAKKIVRAVGVSCHSLPALKRAVEIDWVDIHLVRVNPLGTAMDTPAETWEAPSDASHVDPVMAQVKAARAKGRGIIGMKIIGGGAFTKAEDREKSVRFAMQCGLLDAVVIGFKSTTEIDEAVTRINKALA